MNENLNLVGAINVLMEVAKIAQARGVLTLDDAVVVKNAIDVAKAFAVENMENSGIDEQADPVKVLLKD